MKINFTLLLGFLLFLFLSQKLGSENHKKELNVSYYEKNLKNKNEAIRIKTLSEIELIKDRKIVPILNIALHDKNLLIRKKAALILGKLSFKIAVPFLIKRLHSENDIFVKKNIIEALGNLKDNRAFFILKKYTKNKELILNIAAKEAFKKITNLEK